MVSSTKKRMSSLNLNRACSTKQNGSPSSPSSVPGTENSYWLISSFDALTQHEAVVLVGADHGAAGLNAPGT